MADGADTPLDMPLAALPQGARGRVNSIVEIGTDDPVSRRLLELGFDDGIEVELLHVGPIGGNPLAVRVGGSLIAMRRSEAARVRLTRLP